MRIPYLPVPIRPDFGRVFSDSPTFWRPEIKVAIAYGAAKQKLRVLVDSGADACLFPRDVADILGINLKTGPCVPCAGIGGGRVQFYFHEVEFFIGQYRWKTKAGFAAGSIGATGLLGQRGFFEHFVVSFDYKNHWIELKQSSAFQTWFSSLGHRTPS